MLTLNQWLEEKRLSPEQALSLFSSLSNQEAFMFLIRVLSDDTDALVSEALNSSPQSVGDVLAREKTIGQAQGRARLLQYLSIVNETLTSAINESR